MFIDVTATRIRRQPSCAKLHLGKQRPASPPGCTHQLDMIKRCTRAFDRASPHFIPGLRPDYYWLARSAPLQQCWGPGGWPMFLMFTQQFPRLDQCSARGPAVYTHSTYSGNRTAQPVYGPQGCSGFSMCRQSDRCLAAPCASRVQSDCCCPLILRANRRPDRCQRKGPVCAAARWS